MVATPDVRAGQTQRTGARPRKRRYEDEPAWYAGASCREGIDPELFFPEKGSTGKIAKRICRRCNVVEECFAYALADEELVGIWGGTNEKERAALRNKLRERQPHQRPVRQPPTIISV